MGNCASTRSPAAGSPDQYSAVLHRDAERRMREASYYYYVLHIPEVLTFRLLDKKGPHKYRKGRHPPEGLRPPAQPCSIPLDPHYHCTPNRSYCLVLETLASRPSSKYVFTHPSPHLPSPLPLAMR